MGVSWSSWQGDETCAEDNEHSQEPCSDTADLGVQGNVCQVRNSTETAQSQTANLSMSKTGHPGQHADFSPLVLKELHWQPHFFFSPHLINTYNSFSVNKKQLRCILKKWHGNRVLFPKCKTKSYTLLFWKFKTYWLASPAFPWRNFPDSKLSK